jgi:hypothetical protein
LSTESLAVCTQVHGTDHNPVKTTIEEKEEGRRKKEEGRRKRKEKATASVISPT